MQPHTSLFGRCLKTYPRHFAPKSRITVSVRRVEKRDHAARFGNAPFGRPGLGWLADSTLLVSSIAIHAMSYRAWESFGTTSVERAASIGTSIELCRANPHDVNGLSFSADVVVMEIAMMKLLERNIASIEERLILVAPSGWIGHGFRHVGVSTANHAQLIGEVQRLRGAVYLEDGAVQRSHLSADGRHRTPEDDRSWHLLLRNGDGHVTACAWFLQHDVQASFEDLRVRNSPLAASAEWRPKLWYAVEGELARARAQGLSYAEVGGWAVAKESRCSSEGLLLALAAYSLGRKVGGALGMTTATVRHASSTILRRLGGAHIQAQGEAIPPYYDPKYGCTMEILGFDSRCPSPKYAPLVELLRRKLRTVPVVATALSSTASERLVRSPEYAA